MGCRGGRSGGIAQAAINSRVVCERICGPLSLIASRTGTASLSSVALTGIRPVLVGPLRVDTATSASGSVLPSRSAASSR